MGDEHKNVRNFSYLYFYLILKNIMCLPVTVRHYVMLVYHRKLLGLLVVKQLAHTKKWSMFSPHTTELTYKC